MKINDKLVNTDLTVITVTYNNADGLRRTLQSFFDCTTLPFVIFVIDGGSVDSTSDVVKLFQPLLNIIYISEPDFGIYDAMNKGRELSNTKLLHYLNAGDSFSGDIYKNLNAPCLLPVKIYDPNSKISWIDSIKLFGYGYCHQGLILPSQHPPFNLNLKLASDFDVLCQTFPYGLNSLPRLTVGLVFYELGGFSSENSFAGVREIIKSAWVHLDFFIALKISCLLIAKSIIPRFFRRRIISLTRRVQK
jgi:glycosyltransferase involved in cell wall biosynthesis